MTNKMFNLYIDESCHLEHDGIQIMCIGYTKIEYEKYPIIKDDIKKIKLKHKAPTELKWNKLSMSRFPLYKELIDYFFSSNITFRCVLVKNKQNLDHEKFNRGDHNAFYYKMIYLLLNNKYINQKDEIYRVILDIKDTRGKERLTELANCLNNKNEGKSPFKYFQHIHSHENELLQLTDLFIGAITYKSRKENIKPNASKIKCEVINYLEKKTGYSLDDGTIPWESKFNIFDFQISSSK
ncbi:MAG TPA: DUF3800 domain-containing protein [Bacteroidales bacterium]|nr:MAG: hypothetical protein A2W98_14740 [Bacteroidetes bacterium GWF2_33_38]OFY75772.1 MAG: hypothetical protein A2265_10015 [Bacteroidetes bacterium RIFOXYA12_FULL_33_9]HBF88609.1 DUF3800 domain-containing protein [Bacteroidales bacterium]